MPEVDCELLEPEDLVPVAVEPEFPEDETGALPVVVLPVLAPDDPELPDEPVLPELALLPELLELLEFRPE